MGRAHYPRTLALDTGALIAIDGGDRGIQVLLKIAREHDSLVFVPAGVLAQAWRDGARQAKLAIFLRLASVHIEALGEAQAKAAGELCGKRGVSDIVDATVVLTARRHEAVVVSSDPDDILHLDPKLEVIRV